MADSYGNNVPVDYAPEYGDDDLAYNRLLARRVGRVVTIRSCWGGPLSTRLICERGDVGAQFVPPTERVRGDYRTLAWSGMFTLAR